MKKGLYVCFVIAVLALTAGMLTLGSSAAPQKEDQKPTKTKCLACHGSFDKIAAATADYETPSGEKTTPHRYIPHAEKKDIPECTECHTPHPVPLEDKSKVVKANIDYCYGSCHHARNLQPCSNCH